VPLTLAGDAEVCVLGGGITGVLTACALHDAGVQTLIVDRGPSLLDGASRWNEGKIHLGFTYTGTPDLASARLMLRGAARFAPVIERVTGHALPAHWWSRPVIYLVDEQSIFPPAVLWDRAQAVAALVRAAAAVDPAVAALVGEQPILARLPADAAMASTAQTGVVAAWGTAERAIAPGPVAEGFRAAVRERSIPIVRDVVRAVRPRPGGWDIACAGGSTVTTNAAVNCLWESRPAIDAPLRPTTTPVVIRYKVGIFAQPAAGWSAIDPSTRILGKYGDVTPYGNGDLYLSWYPTGMLARSDDGAAPPPPPIDAARAFEDTVAGLRLPAPLVAMLHGQSRIEGGYVVAQGTGDISECSSSLHDRHHARVRLLAPGFVSVDTGKYTLGPLLAAEAAQVALRCVRPHAAAPLPLDIP
jgi:glycine/D-amino acid oxidase-like deaminating enzyme